MRRLRWALLALVGLLVVGCGDRRILTADDFAGAAREGGYDLQPSPYYASGDSVKWYAVRPGDFTVAVHITASASVAKRDAEENNRDVGLIRRRVEEEGPLCEFADTPEAFPRANLVLWVQLGARIFTPENCGLVEIFNSL